MKNLTSKLWGLLNIYFCHLFVFFLPFGCHFLVVFSSSAGGWNRSRAGKSKNAISPAHFLAVFSSGSGNQASGEGGKPGLGNAKKMPKKRLPVWEMQKKCQKHDSQSGKHDCAGKVTFLEFPGRPRFSGPPGPAPHPVFEPALHPEPGDNSSSRKAQKWIFPGKLPCPILLHRLAFQEFLHLFLLFGAATR